MTLSKDLFLSILSMDAYNRGYNVGIAGLSDDSSGTAMIGNAYVSHNLADADLESEAFDAGFYAVSYTLDTAVGNLAAGDAIISYRGTDNLGLLDI